MGVVCDCRKYEHVYCVAFAEMGWKFLEFKTFVSGKRSLWCVSVRFPSEYMRRWSSPQRAGIIRERCNEMLRGTLFGSRNMDSLGDK